MATILPQALGRSGQKLHNIRIDMTPMVDLAFLLITFFIFTTTLSEPTITKLSMPSQQKIIMEVTEDRLLTILVDKNKTYVYNGSWEKALADNRVYRTDYNLQTGVGNFIRQKQKQLDARQERDELMVAIKPLATASYQDVMNALDEMHINGVKRYGIMQISQPEIVHAIAQ